MPQQHLSTVQKWFTETFFQPVEPDGSIYFCTEHTWFTGEQRGPKLGREVVLFSSSVDSAADIIPAVINHMPVSAGFTYGQLVQAISKLSTGHQEYVFYVRDPDNCFSLLCSFLELNNWKTDVLSLFAAEPSIQGGNCYLGMLDDTCSWMLVHEFCPCNDFTIFLHAGPTSCSNVVAELCARQVPDRRLL